MTGEHKQSVNERNIIIKEMSDRIENVHKKEIENISALKEDKIP